ASRHHALIKTLLRARAPVPTRVAALRNFHSCTAGGILDFQLNDEQLHLKKSVREFAEREILPNVMKWDEAGEFPLATIKELGKLGMLGTIFPPELGGAGMGYVEYVTAIEELSRVDGSVGIIVAAHTSLCSNHIFLAGNDCQRKKYIPKL